MMCTMYFNMLSAHKMYMFCKIKTEWNLFFPTSTRVWCIKTRSVVHDIMRYTETHEIPVQFLLVDFEKAFDSLSSQFIQNVLDIFNFKCP